MPRHVRTGIAVSLFATSILSLGCLILNPRFVDDARLGFVIFLALPLAAGLVGGPIVGYWVHRLALVGSSEAPLRAYQLLWATMAGSLTFFGTLTVLPSFLGIFSNSETLRYGGGLLLAGGLAWIAVHAIRGVAEGIRPWVWPLLFALPVTVVVLGGTPWGKGLGSGSRVVVLAFPGLSWNVAEDLIDRGEMPNLAELRRSGAWGDLTSVKGMNAAVWTSIATGKTSDVHGVHSFNATTQDVRSRRIWEILEERGWSVGLFGWPVTWPPPAVDGFVVPAVSDPGSETHPRELRFIRELAMREKTRQERTWGIYCRFAFLGVRYGARLSTLIDALGELLLDPLRGRNLDTAQLFNKRKIRAKLNCDYFVELRRRTPVDFAAFHSNIVHVAQAYFWKYHEPDAFEGISPGDISRYGDSVHDAYRIVDAFVGQVIADTGENDLVLVVSDHGAEALADPYQRLTLRIEPTLLRMRLNGAVEATNVGARTYLRMKPGHTGNEDRVRRLFDTARLDRADRRAFLSRVDEWGNVEVTVAPQVGTALDDYLLFQGGRCPVSEVIRPLELQESAKVRETGALVLAGKSVEAGSRFDGADLFDIVPTLLVLNGLDLAADLPGDVIEDAVPQRLLDRVPGMVATYDRVR